MATVICMDGLGGNPETTFGELKLRLEDEGHRVVLVSTRGIRTHEDRVENVLMDFVSVCGQSDDKVFLLGFSAGGSAVRLAARHIEKHDLFSNRLAGVILLSQAMPWGVNFLTWPLIKVMVKRLPQLIFGLDINPTESEYTSLVEPVSNDRRDEGVKNRRTIPGTEAQTLAFHPSKFEGYSYPSLVIYGDSDRWVATRAHRKMIALLKKKKQNVTSLEVPHSGHLVLASEVRQLVMLKIQDWIGTQ